MINSVILRTFLTEPVSDVLSFRALLNVLHERALNNLSWISDPSEAHVPQSYLGAEDICLIMATRIEIISEFS